VQLQISMQDADDALEMKQKLIDLLVTRQPTPARALVKLQAVQMFQRGHLAPVSIADAPANVTGAALLAMKAAIGDSPSKLGKTVSFNGSVKADDSLPDVSLRKQARTTLQRSGTPPRSSSLRLGRVGTRQASVSGPQPGVASGSIRPGSIRPGAKRKLPLLVRPGATAGAAAAVTQL
jgi:hypothetical protein